MKTEVTLSSDETIIAMDCAGPGGYQQWAASGYRETRHTGLPPDRRQFR